MNRYFQCDAPPIALALSGGADSMALLLILKEQYPHLHALTVDHRLRPESAAEAYQVALWCKMLAVPHTTLVWEHENITSGIPEKARNARYALMSKWCINHNIDHLFTAHHLDDQIETMLLRLSRGSGLVGLSGMLPISRYGALTLHRPLLSTPKSALISLLKNANQRWIEDPSNHNMSFTRNAMRPHLHTLTSEQKQRFDAVAQSFARFRTAMESRVEIVLHQCLVDDTLHHDNFMKQPHELKLRILQQLCHKISENNTPIRSEKISRLLMNIEGGKGKHMLHGVIFEYLSEANRWQLTQTKSLAAHNSSAMNKSYTNTRKKNAQ